MAPVADHHAPDLETCAVCERTILRGEILFAYVTPAGDARQVCALCRKRAEAAGWMPARLAEEIVQAGPAVASRPSAHLAGPRAPSPEPVRPRQPEAPLIPDDRSTLERAVNAFNAGSEPRKIAGLSRSLGVPSVAIEEADDSIVVTVAWELSWYRWEVTLGRGGAEVAEIAKGTEVEEIDPPAPEWNARVGDDGRLALESG